MVSLERLAQRATCVIDQLENRIHFAFGDLNPSWGNGGLVTLRDPGSMIDFEMAVQPNGQVIVGYKEGDDSYVIRRLLPNGKVDHSFGQNGQFRFANDSGLSWDYSLSELVDGSLLLYQNISQGPQEPGGLLSVYRIDPGGNHYEAVDRDGVYDIDFHSNLRLHIASDLPASYVKALKAKVGESYFYTWEVVRQGKYNVVVFSSIKGVGVVRLNYKTGEIDKRYAMGNSQNHDGIWIFDFVNNSTEFRVLPDGSILYMNQKGDRYGFNQVEIGHITKDGETDRQFGNKAEDYRIVFHGNPNLFLYPDDILLGKSGEVYVVMAKNDFDRRVYQFDMTTSKLGQITGRLFKDMNSNNKQDPGETSIAGRSVFIDENNNSILDRNEWSVDTDANGNYSFDGVLAGTYNVRRMLPAGYKVTNPLFSKGSITIKTGQKITANIGSVKV